MTNKGDKNETDIALDTHLLLSLGIPVVFLVFAGLIKSLVRRELFWSNFYLGIDLSLASLANGVINVADLGSTLTHLSTNDAGKFASKMYYNAIVLVLAFGTLLLAMGIHQRLESNPPDFDGRTWRKVVWLGVVANTLGAGSMFAFITGKLRGVL